MIEKAIEKIKYEINKDKNPYMKIIGNYVLSQIEINPSSIESIADGSKNLKGSLKEMEKEAKKRAVGNVGILTDEEGLTIVAKYFGFEITQISADEAINKSNAIDYKMKKDEKHANKPDVEFNVSLDDFLK